MERIRASRSNSLPVIAHGLVHKLRNSLNTLQTQIAVVQKLVLLHPDDLLNQQIRKLDQHVGRMDGILKEFLAFADPPASAPESIRLDHLAAQILDFLQDELKTGKITVIKEFADKLPTVSGDPGQLRRAIIHLVVNAKQAMPEGGQLTIRTTAGAQGRVMLDVMDSGCGIPADSHDRLLEPFFTTKPGALGLGLSIVEGVARQHFGELTFDSQPDGGALFRLILPSESRRSAVSRKPKSRSGAKTALSRSHR